MMVETFFFFFFLMSVLSLTDSSLLPGMFWNYKLVLVIKLCLWNHDINSKKTLLVCKLTKVTTISFLKTMLQLFALYEAILICMYIKIISYFSLHFHDDNFSLNISDSFPYSLFFPCPHPVRHFFVPFCSYTLPHLFWAWAMGQ